MRQGARSLRDSAAVANMRGAGDLVERDVVMGTALHRLDQLAIGDQPLVLRSHRLPGQRERQRLAQRSREGERTVTPTTSDDSRCPTRRSTRSSSTGARRSPRRSTARRASSRSDSRADATSPFDANEVTSVEDEYFADADGELDLPEDEIRAATEEGLVDGGLALGGPGALLAALGRARTGSHGRHHRHDPGRAGPDHPQPAWRASCWSRVVRAPARPPSRCTVRPTCSSPSAPLSSARASSWSDPNPLFLNYIENVLPSLGESGVTLSTIAGLVTNVDVRAIESEDVDQLKGDLRMARCSPARCALASARFVTTWRFRSARHRRPEGALHRRGRRARAPATG